VDLSELLSGHQLASITELTLTAAHARSNIPFPHQWPVETATLPLAPGKNRPQFDISSHGKALPLVEMFPMEIRTFEAVLA
jgi:hypothetical protein